MGFSTPVVSVAVVEVEVVEEVEMVAALGAVAQDPEAEVWTKILPQIHPLWWEIHRVREIIASKWALFVCLFELFVNRANMRGVR